MEMEIGLVILVVLGISALLRYLIVSRPDYRTLEQLEMISDVRHLASQEHDTVPLHAVVVADTWTSDRTAGLVQIFIARMPQNNIVELYAVRLHDGQVETVCVKSIPTMLDAPCNRETALTARQAARGMDQLRPVSICQTERGCYNIEYGAPHPRHESLTMGGDRTIKRTPITVTTDSVDFTQFW